MPVTVVADALDRDLDHGVHGERDAHAYVAIHCTAVLHTGIDARPDHNVFSGSHAPSEDTHVAAHLYSCAKPHAPSCNGHADVRALHANKHAPPA